MIFKREFTREAQGHRKWEGGGIPNDIFFYNYHKCIELALYYIYIKKKSVCYLFKPVLF
jgi:hypothetical protein